MPTCACGDREARGGGEAPLAPRGAPGRQAALWQPRGKAPCEISLKGCEAAPVQLIYDDDETQKRVCFWEVPAAGKAGAFVPREDGP